MSVRFKVGDKAVYPSHGVAQITGVKHREIAGVRKEFFILNVLDSDMKLMIPTDGATRAGLRDIISKEDAKKIVDILKVPIVAATSQPWNRRQREYTEMLNSGSAFEVAKVLRDLYSVKDDTEFSYSERRLRDQAFNLLVSEIALALECEAESVRKELMEALDWGEHQK